MFKKLKHKKIKAYKNRFSAMVAGLNQFGLTGIKENKYRVAAGSIGVLATSSLAYCMIHDGINKLKNKNIS